MARMKASPDVVAGIISILVFAASAVPMLVKAHRTKDLQSYSQGNLVLIHAGNAVHTVYVVSLPFGPIWFLHSFYTVSSLAMLGYYLRHARGAQRSASGAPGGGGPGTGSPHPQHRSRSV